MTTGCLHRAAAAPHHLPPPIHTGWASQLAQAQGRNRCPGNNAAATSPQLSCSRLLRCSNNQNTTAQSRNSHMALPHGCIAKEHTVAGCRSSCRYCATSACFQADFAAGNEAHPLKPTPPAPLYPTAVLGHSSEKAIEPQTQCVGKSSLDYRARGNM